MLMKEFSLQRFLGEDGRNQLSMELLSFQSDSSLPIYSDSTDTVQLWTAVMKTSFFGSPHFGYRRKGYFCICYIRPIQCVTDTKQ